MGRPIAAPQHASAVISDDGVYRYRLDRQWGRGPRVCWVMFNPSTADGTKDDPTIRRCIAFSKSWGFGSMVVVNLFAYRASRPRDLFARGAMPGPENDRYIHEAIEESEQVICAWGADAHVRTLARERWFCWRYMHRGLWCIAKTPKGSPRHPLYLPGDLAPVPFP